MGDSALANALASWDAPLHHCACVPMAGDVLNVSGSHRSLWLSQGSVPNPRRLGTTATGPQLEDVHVQVAESEGQVSCSKMPSCQCAFWLPHLYLLFNA